MYNIGFIKSKTTESTFCKFDEMKRSMIVDGGLDQLNLNIRIQV